ncbi:hypothetical protein LYSHEL_23150 [Lysobacter helvus]|uniref:Secreted protein n=2 Tax=Lysobacteraceae TaxID=32033 RepID=A0ABN6FXK8_9GAMM|nr:hypothetical protein LYSCAS_23150 [Lysobacter caseinilyticus]BCT96444.1 hypothetical protein LYSHEL_23150 [Lysobacter helvus]
MRILIAPWSVVSRTASFWAESVIRKARWGVFEGGRVARTAAFTGKNAANRGAELNLRGPVRGPGRQWRFSAAAAILARPSGTNGRAIPGVACMRNTSRRIASIPTQRGCTE